MRDLGCFSGTRTVWLMRRSLKSVKLAQRHLSVNHRLASGAVGPGLRLTDASLLYCLRRHINCLVLPVAQSELSHNNDDDSKLIRNGIRHVFMSEWGDCNIICILCILCIHMLVACLRHLTDICQACRPYSNTRWRLNRVPRSLYNSLQ